MSHAVAESERLLVEPRRMLAACWHMEAVRASGRLRVGVGGAGGRCGVRFLLFPTVYTL